MRQSESIDLIAPAFVKVLGLVSDVVKSTDNAFGGYKYAALDAVTEMARPILAANDLGYTQEIIGADNALLIVTRFWHASGQWIETEPLPLAVEDRKGMTRAQAVGSTITYGRRYALQAALGITAEADDDASDARNDAGKTPVGIARRAQLEAAKQPNQRHVSMGPDLPSPTRAKGLGAYPRRGDPGHGISEQEAAREDFGGTREPTHFDFDL